MRRMKDFITPPPIYKKNLLQALLLEERVLARKRRIRFVAGSSFAAAALLLLLLLTVAMPGPAPVQPVTVQAVTGPMGFNASSVADLYQKAEDISARSKLQDESLGKNAVDKAILLKSGKPLQLQIELDELEEQAYALAY